MINQFMCHLIDHWICTLWNIEGIFQLVTKLTRTQVMQICLILL